MSEWQDHTPIIMPGARPAGQRTIAPRGGAGAAAAAHLRALDEATDIPLKKRSVEPASRQALVQARLAKSWTQDQADAAHNFPKHTFKGIENGSLLPTGPQLSRISSVLKVNLKFV